MDYKMTCRVCSREFISYKGAPDTEAGRTCPTCWWRAHPATLASLGCDVELLSPLADPIPDGPPAAPPPDEPLFADIDKQLASALGRIGATNGQ